MGGQAWSLGAIKTVKESITMEKSIKRDVGMVFTLSVRHGGVHRPPVFSHAINWKISGCRQLFNSVGECYQGLGKIKEALAAFERSLELSPDQPEVRKRVDELKQKKSD